MKLRNRKTGEIIEVNNIYTFAEGKHKKYDSLEEFNEEWEDYEEQKEDGLDNIISLVDAYSNLDSERYPREIAEKLKAWKRLKDKGFRFMHNKVIGEYGNVSYRLNYPICAVEEKDLDLLFYTEVENEL